MANPNAQTPPSDQQPGEPDTNVNPPVDNTEPTTGETKPPCNSCAITAINKGLKNYYISIAAAIIAILGGLWLYKKFESPNKLFIGAIWGAATILLIYSVLGIINLNKYKKELTNPTPATA